MNNHKTTCRSLIDELQLYRNEMFNNVFLDEFQIGQISKNYSKDFQEYLDYDENAFALYQTMYIDKQSAILFILADAENGQCIDRIFGYDENDDLITMAYSNNENDAFENGRDFKMEELYHGDTRKNAVEKLQECEKIFMQVDILSLTTSQKNIDTFRKNYSDTMKQIQGLNM